MDKSVKILFGLVGVLLITQALVLNSISVPTSFSCEIEEGSLVAVYYSHTSLWNSNFGNPRTTVGGTVVEVLNVTTEGMVTQNEMVATSGLIEIPESCRRLR